MPEGLARLPLRGPAIVAVNHTTIADVPAVLSSLHKGGLHPSAPCHRDGCGDLHGHVRFMASTMVFAHPLIGPLARRGGMIEVGARLGGAAALKAAHDALSRGEIIGIYPEGDVSASVDGAPRRFHFGVARLAAQSSAPVVPVAHHDARRIGSGSIARTLAGTLTSIVRRPTIRLRVGAPIRPDEFAGLALRDVLDLIEKRVGEVWRAVAGVIPAAPAADQPEKPL